MFKPGSEKKEALEILIADICRMLERSKEFRVSVCFTDTGSLWPRGSWGATVVLQETDAPQHLIVLMGNLHRGQEATVRTGHKQKGFL